MILQLRQQSKKFSLNLMNTYEICSINIYEMYNSLSINYNEILLKKNLFVLK